MKLIVATEQGNHFAEIVKEAIREPILIELPGHLPVVMLTSERYEELVSAQDALWEAAAMEIVKTSQPVAPEEGLKILSATISDE